MMRLNSVLLLAVIASAMYLVQVQYQSRRLFVEVEKAQSLSRKLEIERERLEVDKRSQATPLRIEKIAKEKLQMRSATPAVTQYVKLPPELAQDQAASPVGAASQQKVSP
ncbi:MAG: cell division protein FtsL [Brachymonas sp.]|nr:cell division protein FtsL [Brachymonas sp.]